MTNLSHSNIRIVSPFLVSWLSRMPSTSATNHPGDDDDVDIDHSGVAEDTTESGNYSMIIPSIQSFWSHQ